MSVDPKHELYVLDHGGVDCVPMYTAMIAAVKDFTMADHANIRIVTRDTTGPDAAIWTTPPFPPPARSTVAVVMDGWVQEYSLGTLKDVKLAAEFYCKAWRERDRMTRKLAEDAERIAGDRRVVRCINHRVGDTDSNHNYARQLKRGPDKFTLGVSLVQATKFKDEVEATEFCDQHLTPFVEGLLGTPSYAYNWHDAFVIEPVPGTTIKR